MQQIRLILQNFLNRLLGQVHMPTIRWTDVVEVIVISWLIYHILLWIRGSRAWNLLRGLVFVFFIYVISVLANMTTITWIIRNAASIAILGVIILLQPELRRALETFGQNNIFNSLLDFTGIGTRMTDGRFSDKTVHEIVRACEIMGRAKTGALIVIQQDTPLTEYERTGIEVDGIVTRQLLINIFEKNTPLHDGAVIVVGDRVTSATCYLPLSESRIDKDLGTRHRAGLGISEETDAMTVIVSEETGNISIAYMGALERSLTGEQLRARLTELQRKEEQETGRLGFLLRKEKERSEG